jgi:hypothetical protein
MVPMGAYCSLLRQELRLRNLVFAKAQNLAHALSYGTQPIVVYAPSPEQSQHGNFESASYAAILRRPQWRLRLEKIHTTARRSLPLSDRRWKELDSSMSSDALLMNIFCHPRTISASLCGVLGLDRPSAPEFGFRARVPMRSGRSDRTEVDMKICGLLVEAKLTETNFQTQKAAIVEAYRDLDAVFERDRLPRTAVGDYVSYQLIRNVLAAHGLQASFCVLLDERRPDLKDAWCEIMQCVVDTDLKTRCKVLTWQELAAALPMRLQQFLDLKYGIVPPGRAASRVWEEESG